MLSSWAVDHPALSTRAISGLFGFILLVLLPWQAALIMGSLLIVLEGALRKWAFPEMQIEMYALKYVVFSSAYLRFFLEWMTGQQTIHVPRPLLAPLLLFAGWVIVQTFNPRLPDFTVGLIGAVQYLFFIPLFVMMPEWCKTERHWIRFYLFHILLSLVPLTVAVVQFFSPLDHPINIDPYGGTCMGSHATLGDWGYCRLSGTFTFVSRFNTYLSILVGVGLSLVLLAHRFSKPARILLNLYLVILLLMVLISQSRGTLFLALGMGIAFEILTRAFGLRSYRPQWRTFLLAGGVATLLIALIPQSDKMVLATKKRIEHEGGEETMDRLLAPVTEPFLAFVNPGGGLLGHGVGTRSYVAGRVATEYNPSELSTVLGAERPVSENVAVELGIPGWVLFYLVKLAFLASFFSAFRRGLTSTQARLLFLPFTLHVVFLLLPLELPYYEASFYLWSLTGLLPRAIRTQMETAAR